jgi:ribosomal protein S14
MEAKYPYQRQCVREVDSTQYQKEKRETQCKETGVPESNTQKSVMIKEAY